MSYKNFFQSKICKVILVCLGSMIVIMFIFQAGVFVGYKKAAFSYRFGEHFYRELSGQHEKFFMGIPRGGFINPHGTIGTIIKIDLPTIVVASKENVEKTVLITNDTLIRRFRDTLQPTDLKADDPVIVIGSPNDTAQIAAKFIRVFPSSTDFTMRADEGRRQ